MTQIELRRNKTPRLNRRSFLAGSGVCMSLPLLEAMLPVGKTAFGQDATPGRMLVFFTGNGCWMQTFQPSAPRNFVTDGFGNASSLEPLSDIRGDILSIKGLHNDPMRGQTGDHGKGSGAFMTCDVVAKNTIDSTRTMDVIAAEAIKDQTRFRNLHLGIDNPGSGFPDNGFSAAYMGNISWESDTAPVPKETSPQRLFDRLFSGDLPNNSGGVDTRGAVNKSVIDAVLADINRLENKLGVADREKLQGYIAGVRELERQLDAAPPEMNQGGSCEKPNLGQGGDYVRNSRLFNDLMVMAFTCDLTRVISYMFSNGLGGRRYSNLGISADHHSISHHAGMASQQALLRQIDRYHMEEYADLCKKLKAAKDIQGNSLLDSCMVMYSSEIADGNSHSHYDLPVLIAGKGNGKVNTGRHITASSDRMANLFLAMMQHVGANVNSFKNSTGPLSLR